MRQLLLMSAAFALICSCNSTKNISDGNSEPALTIVRDTAGIASPLSRKPAKPFAVIYQTNGDYDNNVTVVYNSETKEFISFPDPTDVWPDAGPMKLADGWLLDRRGGIGPDTRFLKWTYAQYHDLKAVPSLEDLREAILPEAKVTRALRLDFTTVDAQRDTAKINSLIRTGDIEPYIVSVLL